MLLSQMFDNQGLGRTSKNEDLSEKPIRIKQSQNTKTYLISMFVLKSYRFSWLPIFLYLHMKVMYSLDPKFNHIKHFEWQRSDKSVLPSIIVTLFFVPPSFYDLVQISLKWFLTKSSKFFIITSLSLLRYFKPYLTLPDTINIRIMVKTMITFMFMHLADSFTLHSRYTFSQFMHSIGIKPTGVASTMLYCLS